MQAQFKHKTGIRRKITLIMCVSTLTVIAVGVSLVYFLGFKVLKNAIAGEYVQMAKLLGEFVVEEFKGEVEDIRSYVTRPLWIEAVEEANLKYEGMNTDEIKNQLISMDKKWLNEDINKPILEEYLQTKISISMKEIVNLRKNIAEIFITDKYGGLVAASEKTTDFYQADERWWKKAYNDGKGRIFIGDIEFDKSSGDWIIPIAVPIRDKDRNVIGICKEGVSIHRFFSLLKIFKIGKTGYAVLVNERGDTLFHYGIPTMSRKYLDGDIYKKISQKKEVYNIIVNPHMHGKKIFTAFSELYMPISEKHIMWKLFIDQDADEVFRPLYTFIWSMIFIMLVMILIMIPVAFVFSGIFTRPIKELHEVTEQIIQGNMNYKINIKTNDEIEQLADSFNHMVANINDKQKQLMQSAADMENKVIDRTKELNEVNEATLNILEDLTETKDKLNEYSKELEEALKVKSDFTSMVSHELRTPLTAIKEGISIVLDGTAGDTNTEQKEFLNIAKRNVDRLVRLINDVLDFQKLESGRMAFNMQENDINEVVKEVQQSVLPLAEQKGLSFDINLGNNIPKIKFDKDRIIQVLMNLVNNAIKFTERGGIIIETSLYKKEYNGILASVKDTGNGIRQEDMTKLFQRFTSINKSNERKTGGTGLGLAISKEIITGHNGKIWAESEFGKGTTFYFVLPK